MLLHRVLDALYPVPCQACSHPLDKGEVVCNWCKSSLPFVDNQQNMLLSDRLAEIMPIHGAVCLLYFQKHEITQTLLHKLKYENKPQIGVELGKLLGERLCGMDFDALLPVPLHPKKLAKRGYNQSEKLCQGMAEVMNVPVRQDVLFRTKNTKTQAQLSEAQRKENTKEAFVAHPQVGLQKVVLVDDVVTTGSTLLACIKALKTTQIQQIWIAVVADAATK